MTLVLPGKKESWGKEFGHNLAEGLKKGREEYKEQQKRDLTKGKMDELGNEIGVKNLGSYSPKIQEEIVSSHFQSKRQAEKYGFEENLQKGKPKDEKSIREDEERNRVKDIGQKSFNGIAKILKRGNVGGGSGVIASLPWGTNTQKDVGEFSSLTGGLEGMLVDMVNRGALSNSRFKYITETLIPKPNDRQEEIRGKLEGLAQILDLDISELTGESTEESGKKPTAADFDRKNKK